MKQDTSPSRRELDKLRRHREWRQKRQDILVSFAGTDVAGVRAAANRVARNAKRFGVAARGEPERREDLPPGHPPVEGIEHADPVIMTVVLDGSMAKVVDLLESDMPTDMIVQPIPSERLKYYRKRRTPRRRGGGAIPGR